MQAQNIHARSANDSTGLMRATNDNMMHIRYATIDNLQPMAIRQKLKICAQITVILTSVCNSLVFFLKNKQSYLERSSDHFFLTSVYRLSLPVLI